MALFPGSNKNTAPHFKTGQVESSEGTSMTSMRQLDRPHLPHHCRMEFHGTYHPTTRVQPQLNSDLPEEDEAASAAEAGERAVLGDDWGAG